MFPTTAAAAGLAVASVLLSTTPAPAEASSTDPGPLTPGVVDAYVHDHLDGSPLPGATVAVTRGTEVVHTAGYGTDSGASR
ncbi:MULTISPECIES: hypothetical protein [unclassified Nocardiopsis]|uniref:hypothetical protein n=1 Tax=unclassified Nocardiopsis TaxID=2649073 RepID=UPI001F5B69CB|nr:hypothetical protein [Nocardiopsis sp. TSRI0078]